MELPLTHEYHELLSMIGELRKRIEALESPPADNTKRQPKDMDEVLLLFAKVGLPESDGRWFLAKMVCSGWRNNGKVIRSWTHCVTAWKLANVFPSQKQAKAGPTSIRDLQAVIAIKEEEMKKLVNRSYNDSGAFHEWTVESDRQRFIVLKREVVNLKARISQSV